MHLGWSEILLILLVLLLLFGAQKIPEIARSLGKASREFKRARDEMGDELESSEVADSDKKEKK